MRFSQYIEAENAGSGIELFSLEIVVARYMFIQFCVMWLFKNRNKMMNEIET